MASIQIHEIETPMEDLSYDVAGNITGGGLFDTIEDFLATVRLIVTETYAFCTENAAPGEAVDCTETLIREIFFGEGTA